MTVGDGEPARCGRTQDRGAHPFSAKAREGLRLVAVEEGRDRQQLSGRDNILTATTVKPDPEHRAQPWAATSWVRSTRRAV